MEYRSAVLSCALLAGAAGLLTSQVRDTKALLPCDLAAVMGEAPTSTPLPAAPAAQPIIPAAVPEAAGMFTAPGGPIAISTSTR